MTLRLRLFVGIVLALALLVPKAPIAGQQPAGGAKKPAAGATKQSLDAPTKQDPLRFRAVMQTQKQDAGAQGVMDIVIERWSTEAERLALARLLAGTSLKEGGQDKLLHALQKAEKVGWAKTPTSLGWDLRYAHETVMSDGTRQIVIATDKPVAFATAVSDSEGIDYPFTIIEMRMKPDDKGEGRMLARSAITTKNNKLELENYGNEPIKLSEIWQEKDKTKK
jgi:hypothetical protein